MIREHKQYSADWQIAAAQNMIEMGGSFAAAIGKAYLVADKGNQERLATAFADLFEKHYRLQEHTS